MNNKKLLPITPNEKERIFLGNSVFFTFTFIPRMRIFHYARYEIYELLLEN